MIDVLGFGGDVLTVAVIGGVVGLDRRVAVQSMASQPLVAVPLLGLALGDLGSALWLGAILQLLWLSSSMFGANVPPNETAASVAIGGAVLLANAHPISEEYSADAASVCLAILAGVPLALVGQWAERRLDRVNLARSRRAEAQVAAGRLSSVGRAVWVGMGQTFLMYLVLVGPAALIGALLVGSIRPVLPPVLAMAAGGMATYVIPALAVAVGLTTVGKRRGLALGMLAFGLATVALAPRVT